MISTDVAKIKILLAPNSLQEARFVVENEKNIDLGACLIFMQNPMRSRVIIDHVVALSYLESELQNNFKIYKYFHGNFQKFISDIGIRRKESIGVLEIIDVKTDKWTGIRFKIEKYENISSIKEFEIILNLSLQNQQKHASKLSNLENIEEMLSKNKS